MGYVPTGPAISIAYRAGLIKIWKDPAELVAFREEAKRPLTSSRNSAPASLLLRLK